MLPRDTDALFLPPSGESAVQLWTRSLPLEGTEGAAYSERRRVPWQVAAGAGVRFLPDLLGRPAVLAALLGPEGELRAVHARWLHHLPRMLNIGRPGGVFAPAGAGEAEPLILVEGLFDDLSLLACGVPAVAVNGKWVDWLPGHAAGHTVLLGFDGTKQGDAAAREYALHLAPGSWVRLRPPGGTKDWNNALRQGSAALTGWLGGHPLLAGTAGLAAQDREGGVPCPNWRSFVGGGSRRGRRRGPRSPRSGRSRRGFEPGRASERS